MINSEKSPNATPTSTIVAPGEGTSEMRRSSRLATIERHRRPLSLVQEHRAPEIDNADSSSDRSSE